MGTRHVYHYHLDSLFHRGIISARKNINKVMRKLLAKYYNINYYCTYKLLFFILRRMINPLYWLSLSKWENSYIKRLVSFDKRQEAARMDKGTDVYISMLALNTPCIISLWMLCLVGFACTKIFRVNILSIIFVNEVFFILFFISMKYSYSRRTNTGNISPSLRKRKGICSTTASMSFLRLCKWRLFICYLITHDGKIIYQIWNNGLHH